MLIKQMMNKINHPSKFIKSKYKVAVVGPHSAGKTSLVVRFVNGNFEQNYHMTIRPSSHIKPVRLEDSLFVRLELIDTLGSGLPIHSSHGFFRDIDAVLLVYDVTNEQSFLKLGDLVSELKSHLPKDILLALVGTHCDRPHLRQVTPQQGSLLKKQKGLSLFYEVSAKTNENVTELFHDLAKYLLIIGSSREKEENPEVSTTFEEERFIGGRSAKNLVLEKKLAYKEEECQKLWKDYEEALQRISCLESRVKDQSSYILNYAGDTEQFQTKIQQLEQQLEEIKTRHITEKSSLEEQHAFSIKKHQERVEDLQQQNDKLKIDLEKLSNELLCIQAIIQEHELNSTNLLERKNRQIENLYVDKKSLYEEKMYLTQLLEQQMALKIRTKLQFEETQAKLHGQIDCKNSQISRLQKELNHSLFLKQENQVILQQYELKAISYREEMVEMCYLEDELAIEHEKYYRMKINYEDSENQMRKEYQAQIDCLRNEKELILQGKDKVVSKIIQSKVNEIRLIRSFIDEIDSNKKESPKGGKGANVEGEQSQIDAKMRIFFDQFIELIQENSQYLHFNLQALLGSLEVVESKCDELLQDASRLDLSQVWYDLKEREENSFLSASIQKPQAHQIWCILNLEIQKRVSKCMAALETMKGRMNEATNDLRVSLNHISDSLSKVDKISEIGLEAYVQSLNS